MPNRGKMDNSDKGVEMTTIQVTEAQMWQNRIKEVNAHFSTGTGTEWVKPVGTGTDSVTPTPAYAEAVEVGHFGTMTRKEAQEMLSVAYRDLRDVQAHIDTTAYNYGDVSQFLPIRDTVAELVTMIAKAI